MLGVLLVSRNTKQPNNWCAWVFTSSLLGQAEEHPTPWSRNAQENARVITRNKSRDLGRDQDIPREPRRARENPRAPKRPPKEQKSPTEPQITQESARELRKSNNKFTYRTHLMNRTIK